MRRGDVEPTAGGRIFSRGSAYDSTRIFLAVELEPRKERGMTASAWVSLARQRLAEIPELANARTYIRPPRIRGLRTSTGTEDIEVKVFGDDLTELRRIDLEIAGCLQQLPGLAGVESSYEQVSPEVRVVIDRRRAADLGLDVGEVARTVRTAVGGSIPTRLTEGDREYDIRVRFTREGVQTAEDLAALPLFPRSGMPLRLRDLAEVSEGLAPSSIVRENQNRLVMVTASVLPAVWSVGEATTAVRKVVAGLQLPEHQPAVRRRRGGPARGNPAGCAVARTADHDDRQHHGHRHASPGSQSCRGGELMVPLAVVVIGGLLVSTALTLFIVPSLYLILASFTGRLATRLLRQD